MTNCPKVSHLLLLTLVFTLLFCAAPVLADSSLKSKIETIVDSEVKYDLFSGTVLVAKDGEVVFSKGCGEANKEYHIPNSLESKFNISSVQKTFIATLMMQLIQDGSLDLNDSITKYFPECPWSTSNQILVKHLLNHTSGLGDYRDNEEYAKNVENFTCIDDVLPLIWSLEPAFLPGERNSYSNASVLLQKGVIEKITGKKLSQILRERIWNALEMDNTTMFVGGDVLENRVSAYQLSTDGKSYKRVMGESAGYSGGGIYTTAPDLLKFDQALYSNQLLSEKFKEIMFTPVEASPNYSYGWQITEMNDVKIIYHGGGSGGFNSAFRRYPKLGMTIIVLSNYELAAYNLANKLESLILDMPYSISTEADSFYKLGMHLQNNKQYKQANDIFEKNTEIENPHLPSLYQAARTRIIGEFEQLIAVELLDKYISLAQENTRPSIAAAWWRKGIALEQLGNIKEALQCQQKCLELDSGFEYAHEAIKRLKSKI